MNKAKRRKWRVTRIIGICAVVIIMVAGIRWEKWKAGEANGPREKFLLSVKEALKRGDFSENQKRNTEGNIAKWIEENKYAGINEFLDCLTQNDINQITRIAVNTELISDKDIPIAERPDKYGQSTLLTLPFKGIWHVVQGNQGLVSHFKGTEEEYAWDFIIVKKGQQAGGNASQNETHYCWEQPLLAPAPGVVVKVEAGLEDHLPFTPNPPRVGNHVYIDHENGEISLLYHLKKGSVMVKVGDRVNRGQPVGLCGDTGISMFPHLHFEHFKGNLQRHTKMETRFFGYYSWKVEPASSDVRPKMQLHLSGIPKRLDFVMNDSELAIQSFAKTPLDTQ
jgi:hypothetical protein